MPRVLMTLHESLYDARSVGGRLAAAVAARLLMTLHGSLYDARSVGGLILDGGFVSLLRLPLAFALAQMLGPHGEALLARLDDPCAQAHV